MLVDKAVVKVQAGRGGNGCESYHKPVPSKIIPTGGNGGKGGDVIFRADSNVSDLEYFKFNKLLRGTSGLHGGNNNRVGRCGDDVYFKVPVGTTITNEEGGYIIRDLSAPGEEVIVVRGGAAGIGNHDHRVRTMGGAGEEVAIRLDYKIDSDVTIVGLPNSGKSTLLSCLTNAKVKMADYPFSSRSPQLGSYECADYSRLTICDLPSIIAESSDGKGIGNKFLKHLLRTKLIFFVLDPENDFAEDMLQALEILQSELKIYDEELLKKKFFVVLNKSDIDLNEKEIKAKETLNSKYKDVYTINLIDLQGLDELAKDMAKVLNR